ncbi:SCO6880 family protein, partial [Aeromicrobium sp.]|uniref:SCO6880 family protein n=1 Tax=Aeromicrobium sp. TaxID=1871063 RepID=UPI00199EC00B
MSIYRDYSRAKVGWFFGLSGWQLAAVSLSMMPIFWSIQRQSWTSALVFLVLWAMFSTIVIVPVRGRSATGWLLAMLRYCAGGTAGWTAFRARATRGRVDDLTKADLPGVLNAIEIHDSPPTGPDQVRIAIIQNHATKTWAATATVTHPGIGMSDIEQRHLRGVGLSDLLDLCSRTELIDELLIVVRTVPDDGAERGQWMTRHRRPGGTGLARQINDDLHSALAKASVRTEAFVTLVVPEARLAKHAKESGGGLEGRARVLYLLMGEVEAQLRGAVGMTGVSWLTSPELAAACRTGFAPGDRAGIIDALAAKENDDTVNADVPWAMAGPSGADQLVRHYSHDAWNPVSATIKLPVKGALMGALAPVLTPTESGERRSYVVSFP